MKKLILNFSSFIIIILFSISFSYSDENNITKGKAIVIDGDTIKIKDEQIRFGAGILGGVPSPMTTYQQQPTASGAQQIAGLGLAGVGAYNAGFFSDAQLKENLELIGTSPSNINIYSFNYKGSKDKYLYKDWNDLEKKEFTNVINEIFPYYDSIKTNI